jgi:chaperonin GroEL (HSP60 family)
MPQGGKKRGRTAKDSDRGGRKAAAKKARKSKKITKKGNPNKLCKKSDRYSMTGKIAKGITGKINNNIEALMAAKVMQVEGHMIMKDLIKVGKEKNTILKKIQRVKEMKHKRRYVKPDKVNVPRI